jgi:TRAP-type C4-dicarboxylate transport system permease small subunit
MKSSIFTAMENGIHRLVRWFSWISAAAISIMILMVMANVMARFFLKKPIPGTIEMVQLIAVVAVFMAVSYTEQKRGHITIDMVVVHFPRPIQAKLASFLYFLCSVFFLVLGWRAILMAWAYLFPRVRETFILYIPFSPFMFVIALGSIALALECFIHIFHPLPPEEPKKGGGTK